MRSVSAWATVVLVAEHGGYEVLAWCQHGPLWSWQLSTVDMRSVSVWATVVLVAEHGGYEISVSMGHCGLGG